jgi:hypothetical protein
VANVALNAITAPDAYTPASTLGPAGAFADHINLDSVNAGIYWQICQTPNDAATPQLATWQAEVYMLPGSRSLTRPGVTGVRVRAAIPAAQLPAGGKQAVVTVEMVQR